LTFVSATSVARQRRLLAVPEIGVNSQLQSMAGFDGFTSDRFVAVRKMRTPGHEPPLVLAPSRHRPGRRRSSAYTPE
ncbi:MAG: hypothetical protein MZW92_24320, partial [Comamonadaceae bacterium]|nr:hypothetical protein [Comamonadaceae bacterium]